MNGFYRLKWGDPNRPDQRFYITFNEGATRGPHFTFTLSLNRNPGCSYFIVGFLRKWKVWNLAPHKV